MSMLLHDFSNPIEISMSLSDVTYATYGEEGFRKALSMSLLIQSTLWSVSIVAWHGQCTLSNGHILTKRFFSLCYTDSLAAKRLQTLLL